jgi:PhzF family phenazine biosynthesis protein
MTEIALVDAFATRPFEGNQAAVILLDEPAEAGWMQSLAAELGYGATCFLHGRDLRWFAPAVELTFCGHGTLATAHLLWERGATEDELQFATASGRLTAHRRGAQIEIDLPVQTTEPAIVPGLAEALGAEPVAVGRAPLDLVAELASADVVRNLAPDLAAVARIDARGVIVTAAGDDGEHAIVSRFFGPAMGIPEDSATGSAHCALAAWWAPRLGNSFRARQVSARGATIDVEFAGDRVRLRAGAVTVLRGEV